MPNIIIKDYEHYNRSFSDWDTPRGKYISSKKHYESEMNKGGFVSFEEGEKTRKEFEKKNPKKEFELSKKARTLIYESVSKADKKGRVKLGDRAIDELKSMGMTFDKNKIKKAQSNKENLK